MTTLHTGLFTEDGLDQVCTSARDTSRERRDLINMGCTVNTYTARDESALYDIDDWMRDGVPFATARARVEAGQTIQPDTVKDEAPVTYTPTKEDCAVIREFAKKEAYRYSGRRDIRLEPGIRVNVTSGELAPNVNLLHVETFESHGDSDLYCHATWGDFRKGFTLNGRGYACVDFYVYTGEGLACNVLAYFDSAGLAYVTDGIDVLWDRLTWRADRVAPCPLPRFYLGERHPDEPTNPAPRSLSAAATPRELLDGYDTPRASGGHPLRAMVERVADAIEEGLELYSDPGDPFGSVRDFVEYPEARETVAWQPPGGRWHFNRNASGRDVAAAFGADVGQWG